MSPLAVYAFPDEAGPAGRLAVALKARLELIAVHAFPDGESLPRVPAPAAALAVFYRSLDRPNGKLADLLLAADALRRAGAERLILVAPYLCYLRQDAVFAPGEPLSRDVICRLLGGACDAAVTVQAHLHRTRDLSAILGVPVHNLWPVAALATALPDYPTPPLIVGPDGESTPWVEAWAKLLGGEPLLLEKTRRGDRVIFLSATPLDKAARRPVVVVDDIISSGATLLKTLGRLSAAGAASIDIAVAHALMSEDVVKALVRAGARRIVSTDSAPHSTNAAPLAPLLAQGVLDVRRRL